MEKQEGCSIGTKSMKQKISTILLITIIIIGAIVVSGEMAETACRQGDCWEPPTTEPPATRPYPPPPQPTWTPIPYPWELPEQIYLPEFRRGEIYYPPPYP
jgi:hypothetical protein